MATTPKTNHRCTLGVRLFEDGSIKEIKEGAFTVSQSEELAARLILLAASVRNAIANLSVAKASD